MLEREELAISEAVPTLVRQEKNNGRAAPKPARLGEELPVFCERCGYSLHGLPQVRCQQCDILQFHCPECGHHQPINTLRPAFQRILGRMRAAILVLWVLFKINYFGWLLFAWFIMGYEWSYRYVNSNYVPTGIQAAQIGPGRYWYESPRDLNWEDLLAFVLFALPFGMVSRMLLLRWRKGAFVGLTLGILVFAAALLGARFRQWERSITLSPLGFEMYVRAGIAFTFVVLGSVAVWPIWAVLVRVFLPQKIASTLLDWQNGGRPENGGCPHFQGGQPLETGVQLRVR